MLIVGHAVKNFTFAAKIGSCENRKNFSRGEKVEELFRICFRCIVFDSFSFEDKKSNFTVLLNSRFIFVYLTLYVTRCIKMKY